MHPRIYAEKMALAHSRAFIALSLLSLAFNLPPSLQERMRASGHKDPDIRALQERELVADILEALVAGPQEKPSEEEEEILTEGPTEPVLEPEKEMLLEAGLELEAAMERELQILEVETQEGETITIEVSEEPQAPEPEKAPRAKKKAKA